MELFVNPKISLQKPERQIAEKEQGLDQGEEGEEAKAGQVRISGTFHEFCSDAYNFGGKSLDGWQREKRASLLRMIHNKFQHFLRALDVKDHKWNLFQISDEMLFFFIQYKVVVFL